MFGDNGVKFYIGPPFSNPQSRACPVDNLGLSGMTCVFIENRQDEPFLK